MIFLLLVLLVVIALTLATMLAPERMTTIGLSAERWRSGLALRHASVDGFDMPYLEGGSGEVLLLVHGFAGDKDNFTRVARFLTPHYRVLIPDLPGFGDAGRDPAASYAMADQVARLHSWLAQLGIERLHLGGNSMGGFIAAQFAATYPKMVDSVWLLDAAGTAGAYEGPLLERYQQTGEMPLLLRREQDFDYLLAMTTHRAPFIPRFMRGVYGRRAVADFDLHTRIMRELAESPVLESMYTNLLTPAFIVWGTQDQIMHPNGAQALATLFSKARVRMMDGIGHLPMVEAPRQAAMDYLAFRRAL
ncbi:MAG: alpha/beta hydrolase [Pseudomonadota bacterium]